MEDAKRIRYTLGKSEKLRHRTLVEGLFNGGESLFDYPLRLNYRILTEEELEASFRAGVPDRIGPLQMLITVPKRKRKRAVDRVLLRRRIREAYRLNRLPLLNVVESEKRIRTLGMAFIYLRDSNADYSTIERKMQRLLHKLEKIILEKSSDGKREEDSENGN